MIEENPISALAANVEAEQMLIGAVLFENTLYAHVEHMLNDKIFFEPLHGRMWRVMNQTLGKGETLNPLVMRDYLAIDRAFKELGGMTYLADLVDRCRSDVGTAVANAKLIQSAFFRRQVMRVAKKITDRANSDPGVDGIMLMGEMERELVAVKVGKQQNIAYDVGEVAAKIIDGFDKPEERPLIMTGFNKIDNVIGGMERGDMVAVAARPSMGKSALAGVIGRIQAQGGLGVLAVNGEMSPEQMTRRTLTDVAFDRYGFDAPEYRKIRQKKLTDREMEILRETAAEVKSLPMKLIKRTGIPLATLRSLARRQKMIFEDMGIPLSLLIVDHAGLVKGDDGHYQNRTAEQTMVSGGMKEIADELDVVVMALLQLNRDCEKREDKRPQLGDLRDSGSWEQDADIVLGVYRDSYYARREQEPKNAGKQGEWVLRCGSKEVEVIALKVREGDLGTAKLWADIGRNAIRDKNPDAYYNDPYGDNT